MQKMWRFVAIGLALLAGIPVAQAQTYRASLAGANENPAVVSAGTGTTTITVDPVTHALTVNTTFTGLNSNTTASHIHCCAAAPANAGVATQTPSFVGFPLGVPSGVHGSTYDMTQAATWNAAFITANGGTPASAEAALRAGLAAGQAYLNIHTTTSPGGELRGFLVLVPPTLQLPTLSTWILGVLALLLAAGAWVALRKRAVA